MPSERQQVLAIARDKDLHAGLDHAREDRVVAPIAGDGLDAPLRHRHRLHCQVGEQLLDLAPSLRVEGELLCEYALQLPHDGRRLILVHLAQDRSHPAGPRPWLDMAIETGGRQLLSVEQWAEIRRMASVERLSQREIRPRFTAPRTYQRTAYRPGELCQFDLC